jgi:proline iminopeptidase
VAGGSGGESSADREDSRVAAVGPWQLRQVGELAAWIRGRGPNCIVLLHGGPGLTDYTASLGDLLADGLGERWRVVRYQQRGQEPSARTGPFTVEQQVADLLDVCETLADDPPVILGHSWGGHLAMHAAVVAQERFRALVIVDPLGALPDGGMAAMGKHFASRLTGQEAAERAELERQMATTGPSDDLGSRDFAIVWPYYFAEPTSAPVMPPIRVSVDASVGVFTSIAKHYERQTLSEGLPAVSLPALFLASTNSPIPHVEAERSAALMPHSSLVRLPLGHFPWMEDPSAVVDPISAFLADHASGAAG